VDALTWYQLNSLIEYWNERPPIQSLLQGIAMALGARLPSKQEQPEVPKITSAEELIGIMRGSGLNFGVIHGSR
jgi:hypothetical protein